MDLVTSLKFRGYDEEDEGVILLYFMRFACANCFTRDGVQWRKSNFRLDNRKIDFCNACGLRFGKGKYCRRCGLVLRNIPWNVVVELCDMCEKQVCGEMGIKNFETFESLKE